MTFEKTHSLLKQIDGAGAITIDDGPLLSHCHIGESPWNPDDIILNFSWNDERGQIFEVNFTADALGKASIEGNSITAMDTNNSECTIKLFGLQPFAVSI